MKFDGEKIISRVEDLAQPVLRAEGFDLVEAQYRRERGGWILRLFIDRLPEGPDSPSSDRPGSGVTLDDCARFSREIGRLLDVKDLIPVAYTLEVSSPGLDRPLKKTSDFQRFAGRLVKVQISGPEGRRKVKGRLLGLKDGRIRLETEDQILEVQYDQAERVQLEPEVDWARA